MKKNKYSIKHSHKHGTDFVLFESELEITELPPIKKLCRLLDIDFDPQWGDEFVDLDIICAEPFRNLDEILKREGGAGRGV